MGNNSRLTLVIILVVFFFFGYNTLTINNFMFTHKITTGLLASLWFLVYFINDRYSLSWRGIKRFFSDFVHGDRIREFDEY